MIFSNNSLGRKWHGTVELKIVRGPCCMKKKEKYKCRVGRRASREKDFEMNGCILDQELEVANYWF